MNESHIVISDSDDNGELPSLTLSSEGDVSDIDDLTTDAHPFCQDHEDVILIAGNPNALEVQKSWPKVCDEISHFKEAETTVYISSGDDDSQNTESPHTHITANPVQLQDTPPQMCNGHKRSRASSGGSGRHKRADSKTLSRAYVSCPVSPSHQPSHFSSNQPIRISSESSGSEDSLPDLDDSLPDLDDSLPDLCGPAGDRDDYLPDLNGPEGAMTHLDFCPRDSSSAYKIVSSSPRKRKQERHFTDLFFLSRIKKARSEGGGDSSRKRVGCEGGGGDARPKKPKCVWSGGDSSSREHDIRPKKVNVRESSDSIRKPDVGPRKANNVESGDAFWKHDIRPRKENIEGIRDSSRKHDGRSKKENIEGSRESSRKNDIRSKKESSELVGDSLRKRDTKINDRCRMLTGDIKYVEKHVSASSWSSSSCPQDRVSPPVPSSTPAGGWKPSPIQRRGDRISQEMQAGSSPLPNTSYKVFSFPNFQKHSAPDLHQKEPEKEKRRTKNRFSGVSFLQDVPTVPVAVNDLCADFVRMQTNFLDDLSDDLSDPNSFSNFIDQLEDISWRRKPSSSLMDKVLGNGFFCPVDAQTTARTYSVVLKIWQRYPDVISMSPQWVLVAGDVLQKRLQNASASTTSAQSASASAPPLGSSGGGLPSFQQAKLFFKLFVQGLQLDLSERVLPDHKSVCRSLAFSCLSSNGSQTLVRQVMQWLDVCQVVRSPPSLVAEAKCWMCQLQTLLAAGVLVSRDRQEAARRLAPELKRTYKYLADVRSKTEFLQSLACPLLAFSVSRLVLEDQCPSVILSSAFPATLSDVVHNYYMALPPADHMTPPPSPLSDEDDYVGGGGGGRGEGEALHSPQACQELAMLVYFVSKSFIACKHRRLWMDLRPQILRGPDVPALSEDQREDLRRSAQEFRAHLRGLCPDLNTDTHLYLSLLDCLAASN